jgi:hypothetical protein
LKSNRLDPRVETEDPPRFNLRSDAVKAPSFDHPAMTTTEYFLNALFVLVVLRQARERRLDLRSVLLPLGLVAFVARLYIHTIPTSGNDLVFIGSLTAIGFALGTLGGLATQVRVRGGVALARVGWIAGGLLVAGIGSRMIFALAVQHGAEPAIRSFSVSHQIGATAWPVALVAMALCEVTARIAIVQARGVRQARIAASIV